MVHILDIVLSTFLVLGIVVSTARSFAETEYIDMVPDKIQDLESGLFEMSVTNPLYVHLQSYPSDMVRGTVQSDSLCTVSVPP